MKKTKDLRFIISETDELIKIKFMCRKKKLKPYNFYINKIDKEPEEILFRIEEAKKRITEIYNDSLPIIAGPDFLIDIENQKCLDVRSTKAFDKKKDFSI